ncbi:SDR family oxidoreductase [Pedobacter nyackensis]|uniref:SDR family oxidoreductase n=1 Tax=Pedobacter nyackensis TaxID=475255 RepID=UPI00292E7AA8|nr:SDR family oxidoreductase [Pedobacter nyackensis]
MRVLLTGSTGYIAQRLLPILLENGHQVICCVRDKSRFDKSKYAGFDLDVVEVDFLNKESLDHIPTAIDVAYYLMHSMSAVKGNFSEAELSTANNFKSIIECTSTKQVIFLSGIVNSAHLSKHLNSRLSVEEALQSNKYALTTLRAGIIVGSGSASFEIIRDLVEKLPVMIAPKWINTRCQPIGIRDVLHFLEGVLMQDYAFNKAYDIGGAEVITYKGMLLRFAKVRGLKRWIFTVPVMTPKLSSYWLYFVTSVSYPLAGSLVESMKVDVVAKPNDLRERLNVKPINYEQSIELAFDKIEQNQVISSWRDAMSGWIYPDRFKKLIEVPYEGCFRDVRSIRVDDRERVLKNVWAIGGERGWYYANWLWGIRGFLDKLFGGVGLQRGRTNSNTLSAGSVIDFWRVILADKKDGRLLLYAEMKLPGEAWLEFKIDKENRFIQTATFRPLGLTGRLYWYAVLPFHAFIFKGMMKNIVSYHVSYIGY